MCGGVCDAEEVERWREEGGDIETMQWPAE